MEKPDMITRRSFIRTGLLLVPAVGLGASPVIVRRSNVSGVNPLSDVDSYWKFEEAAGAMVDSIGGRSFTAAAADYSGYTYQEAGVNQKCISRANNTAVGVSCTYAGFQQLTQPFTVSLWANIISVVNSGGAEYNLLLDTINSGADIDWWAIWHGNTTVSLQMKCNNLAVFLFAIGSFVVGSWFHVVMSWNTLSCDGYVNGVKSSIGISNPPTDNTEILYIGRRLGDSYGRCNAYFDELAFWRRALSEKEVVALYNSGSGRFL